MKKVILFSTLIALTIFAGSASAIGEREKGVLIGIGTSLLYDRVFRQPQGFPGGYPGPGGYGGYGAVGTYGSFPPFRCSAPNPQSVQCSYERGQYERARQIHQQERQDAYRCGRYGECN